MGESLCNLTQALVFDRGLFHQFSQTLAVRYVVCKETHSFLLGRIVGRIDSEFYESILSNFCLKNLVFTISTSTCFGINLKIRIFTK